MSHILDLKNSVLGQQFFLHGKTSFDRSRCALRILKHEIHKRWNILPIHIYYFRNVIVFHFFLKCIGWCYNCFHQNQVLGFLSLLLQCFFPSFFTSLTRQLYWSLILRSWSAKPRFCKLTIAWVTTISQPTKLSTIAFTSGKIFA